MASSHVGNLDDFKRGWVLVLATGETEGYLLLKFGVGLLHV